MNITSDSSTVLAYKTGRRLTVCLIEEDVEGAVGTNAAVGDKAVGTDAAGGDKGLALGLGGATIDELSLGCAAPDESDPSECFLPEVFD